MKAIVLAGGLGTRLRKAVPELPKPMAPIAGKPFLEILLSNITKHGVNHITLSVGYRYDMIKAYFGDSYREIPLRYVIEKSPLGTGGALRKAVSGLMPNEPVFVINGDTFLQLDMEEMHRIYYESGADVGIALKAVSDTMRYGRVVLSPDGSGVQEFEEKGIKAPGFINAGLYLLQPKIFDSFGLPEKFSLEKDCFAAHLQEINFLPFVAEGYFIDIGVPEDYLRAQYELKKVSDSKAIS
jgi:D-glycero-alpha-D-manno-heptose 1-phosphate guanylyltransferase